MDSTALGSIERPNGTSVTTDTVGLLNVYEYQSSYNGGTDGYLNNGLHWFTITSNSSSNVQGINTKGQLISRSSVTAAGVRPSINLKSNIEIASGDGTMDNPYRLKGDNDSNLEGTLLNTRYSGEYITFGTGENTLYRIVSHENKNETKITSAEPLKDAGEFIKVSFDSNDNPIYSSTNTIGTFLNGDYLTNYVGDTYSNMIEENITWYLGTVGSGDSYKLAKYVDTNMSGLTSVTTNAKVGLLRYGELMTGQFAKYFENESNTGLTTTYWTLTPSTSSYIRPIYGHTLSINIGPSLFYGVKPALNLKSNVVITGGDGTKEHPFEIALQ